MTRTPKWIAEERVILVHPDETRVVGHIAIGEPYYLVGDDDGHHSNHEEAKCAIEIDSIYSPRWALSGGGKLQALLLGARMLGSMLHNFVSTGGRVLDPEDESDVPLDALFGTCLVTAMEASEGVKRAGFAQDERKSPAPG